ncbi:MULTISPECIES: NACHT domain-containing protein [unclassified Crossiella]|uniref:NACHT domain-containing protein n=1 Tax=unclassified Crossiella TaxID=2620835 RepID=UPI001FFEF6D2|nr:MULTISPECIES: NACHT domain-containing protein [unclassified Crossiella]MCK2239228.1 NACHT domain-containing protein [Crossiella sp. S99.2]MCK2251203.1 NACHT domain-containing protein [Crossiella sp. S99.1]
MTRRATLAQIAVWGVLVLGLTVMWVRYGASNATTLLTLLSGGAAVAQLLVATRWRPGSQPSTPEQLQSAADALGFEVRRQWAAEARRRMLEDGDRLPVRCRGLGESGSVDLGELISGFGDAPRRLVVIGEPGAGKTGFCLLLILELLRRGDPGRTPVLLQVSGWHPAENLDAWLLRSLVSAYPFLGNESRFGMTAARDLLGLGRILPVLDGLDELPAELREVALRALDKDLGQQEPLVLTCRSAEFAAANAGGAVRESQVVELLPLAEEAIAGYLLDSTPRARLELWEPVLDRLVDASADPLARALRTPLMVSLARTAYRDPGTDPGDLLALASAEGVAARLLDEFTSQAFATRPPSPLSNEVDPVGRWDPVKAERWLSYLARTGERELDWWRLWLRVPRPVFLVSGALVGGFAATPLGLLLLGLFGRPGLGALLGLAIGAGGGALLGLLRAEAPRRFVPRLLRRHELGRDLVFGLVGAIAGGIAVGVVYGGVYGLVIGSVFGLAFGVVRRFTEPTEPAEAVTPASVLRGDQLSAVYAAGLGAVLGCLTGGFLAGVVGVAGLGLAVPVSSPVLIGLLGAGVGAVLGAGGLGLTVLATSAAGRFRTTRVWFWLRGRTPLRLMRFLDDAHRLGVLRLAGASYQFRHELLRDRLAGRG